MTEGLNGSRSIYHRTLGKGLSKWFSGYFGIVLEHVSIKCHQTQRISKAKSILQGVDIMRTLVEPLRELQLILPHFRLISRYNLKSLSIDPLTPKIWLSILPSSYKTFPCDLITRIRCSITVINCTWWVWVFSLSVYCITYGYYTEKLHGNHFWEFKAERSSPDDESECVSVAKCSMQVDCYSCVLTRCNCFIPANFCCSRESALMFTLLFRMLARKPGERQTIQLSIRSTKRKKPQIFDYLFSSNLFPEEHFCQILKYRVAGVWNSKTSLLSLNLDTWKLFSLIFGFQ